MPAYTSEGSVQARSFSFRVNEGVTLGFKVSHARTRARFGNESYALELAQAHAKQRTSQEYSSNTVMEYKQKKYFKENILSNRFLTKTLLRFVSSKITAVVNFLQLVLGSKSVCMPR